MTAVLLASGIAAEPMTYPSARKGEQVDEYHGEKVPDPYRWLEEDTAPETREWIEAQNKVTFGFLRQIPERAKIEQRLTQLWNYERFGIPILRGGRYFFSRNSGLQNQSVLYVAESLSGEPRLLLDPNTLSEDGTTGLAGYEPSEDGALLAYGISRAGSDWQEWRVRDVSTGKDREDLVQWVKFSGASWAKDGSGFFYSRFDEPAPGVALTGLNEFQKLYFHKLGTTQGQDILIYERRDQGKWGFGGGVTDDGRYLAIHVSEGTAPKNRFFYKDLTLPESRVVELLREFDARYEFIGNDGAIFFFSTDLDAPRGRVIAIDLARPEREHWQEVIAQTADTLDDVSLVGGQFICRYLKDAHSVVRLHAQEGAGAKFTRELVLPGLGTARGFRGTRADSETFFFFSSYTMPGTIYRLEPATGATTVFRQPSVDFRPEEYETRQVFIPSKDGTKVPMFITHRRGMALNGAAPTLLYGYGGFRVSLTPNFSVSELVWMEMGGVCATANLRGGGEYGDEWHNAGMKLQKQNVFDDFIAAAEWLIVNKYTSPAKLAIQGGSNGGLLVGACMTQRPELFAAALPAVGVLDMLRFEKFTIGWAWRSDFGSVENADEYRAMRAYSPLHALKLGVRYPATLITTGDHDDRVVPAHSFKYAARLQACQAPDGPPVLIRIETRAGHGAHKPISKVIAERADVLAFLTKILGAGTGAPSPGPENISR